MSIIKLFLIYFCYIGELIASDNSSPKLGPVLKSQTRDVNSSLRILCDVQQGDQPLFFEWSKNSQPIKSVPGVKWEIENSKMFSILNIDKISKEDAGNYSCLVKNIYGSDSINVMLTVKGIQISHSFHNYLSSISIYGAIDTVNLIESLFSSRKYQP